MSGRERWLAAVLACLATSLFFLDYLPPFERIHLFSDIEQYHFPLVRYAFESLKAGRLPQWDPSMYCGIPFVGNIQAGLFYPPLWLLFAASWRFDVLPFQALQFSRSRTSGWRSCWGTGGCGGGGSSRWRARWGRGCTRSGATRCGRSCTSGW